MNNLTEEQMEILQKAKSGIISIDSLAGTGKTSTLIEWCKLHPNDKILYLVFGKAMQMEGQKMFKYCKNVEVKTTHALAYKDFGSLYKDKLTFSYRAMDCMKDLGLNRDYETANDVLNLFNSFLSSDSLDIEEYVITRLKSFGMKNEGLIRKLSQLCLALWNQSCDLNDSTKVTHDFYLKKYQMSNPNLGQLYDYVLVDECIHKDMYVITEEGDVKISTLHNRYQSGERVPKIKSYNIEKEIYEYKPMNFSKETKNKEVFEIKTEGLNKIRATSNHPVLTQRGYVHVSDLKIGEDYLILDKPENQKTKMVLNDDQTQMLIGSYLGDGCVNKRSDYNTYRIGFTQGYKQLGYLKMKADVFNIDKIKEIESGYTGRKDVYQTNSSKTFITNDNMWNMVSQMDARALAIWYMDDGSYVNGYCTIHSNNFSYYQNLDLAILLYMKFGIKASVDRNKTYYYLRFNKENSQKLLEITAPYMHSDLFYKNPLSEGLNYRYKWDNKFKPYGGNFVTSITPYKIDTVYDIGVEDNHNFIVKGTSAKEGTGVIVHNCQDSTNTIKGIVTSSKDDAKGIILIGDPNQSIYSFRGCINLLDKFEEAQYFQLTGSFRVGQKIADMSSLIINLFKNKDIRMRGYNDNQRIYSSKYLSFSNMQGKFNIIARTNATILAHALEASSRGMWLYFEGGVKSYPFQFYKDLYWFRATNNTKNRELKKFKDWKELSEYAEEAEDVELLNGIKFINIYGKKFDSLPHAIDNVFNYVADKKEHAQFCYCTAHKSKGLTFTDPVLIENDFPEMCDWMGNLKMIRDLGEHKQEKDFLQAIEQEVNLLYVAMTRAKGDIYLNDDMCKFFNLE